MSGIIESVLGAAAGVLVKQTYKSAPRTPYVPYEPEGLTLLIKLGILGNYDGKLPPGTLISFKEHDIEYDIPEFLQGYTRWRKDVGSQDLALLSEHLAKSMRRIALPSDSNETQAQIKSISDFVITGLEALKKTYEVFKPTEEKKCANVKEYIKNSIEILREVNVDHSTDTPLDKAVCANYREGNDIARVATIITRLKKPDNSTEMCHAYIQELTAFVNARLLEFKKIKQSVS